MPAPSVVVPTVWTPRLATTAALRIVVDAGRAAVRQQAGELGGRHAGLLQVLLGDPTEAQSRGNIAETAFDLDYAGQPHHPHLFAVVEHRPDVGAQRDEQGLSGDAGSGPPFLTGPKPQAKF